MECYYAVVMSYLISSQNANHIVGLDLVSSDNGVRKTPALFFELGKRQSYIRLVNPKYHPTPRVSPTAVMKDVIEHITGWWGRTREV